MAVQMSSTRASQIICTGITVCVLGFVILGIGYFLSYGKYHLTSVLGDGVIFWVGIPVSIGEFSVVFSSKETWCDFCFFSLYE